MPTKNDLMAELDRLYTLLPVQPSEVTGPMMAKIWNVSTQSAGSRLRRLERDGQLSKPVFRRGASGQPILAWSKNGKA